jgi:hypothetical protein
MPHYARHIRLDRHYHLFINLNNFYIMYKKILLQALVLVLFAAFAMASSEKERNAATGAAVGALYGGAYGYDYE